MTLPRFLGLYLVHRVNPFILGINLTFGIAALLGHPISPEDVLHTILPEGAFA